MSESPRGEKLPWISRPILQTPQCDTGQIDCMCWNCRKHHTFALLMLVVNEYDFGSANEINYEDYWVLIQLQVQIKQHCTNVQCKTNTKENQRVKKRCINGFVKFIPSKGFTSPALFQSNCAAGTSGDRSVFIVASILLALKVSFDLNCAVLLLLLLLLALELSTATGFNGSIALYPKLAAKRGSGLFQLSPYIWNNSKKKHWKRIENLVVDVRHLQYSLHRFPAPWSEHFFRLNSPIGVAVL